LNGSTVSGNTVIREPLLCTEPRRGIANYGTLTVTNSTISGNSASQGYGRHLEFSADEHADAAERHDQRKFIPGDDWQRRSRQSWLADDRQHHVAGNSNGDLSGDVISEGYNVFGTTDGNGFDPTDLLDADPMLGRSKTTVAPRRACRHCPAARPSIGSPAHPA
jgi:hypothetical protein